MSNIIELFIDRGPRVIIDGGLVSETIVQSERGTERIVHQPAEYRYFVDVVEADGGKIGMWDGLSYAEAMTEARACSADWGNAPIVNRCLS